MGGRGRKYSKSHKSQALSEPLDVPAEALCLQLSLPSSADLEQLLDCPVQLTMQPNQQQQQAGGGPVPHEEDKPQQYASAVMQLESWSQLPAVLSWFSTTVLQLHPSAKLSFPACLPKDLRADVHTRVSKKLSSTCQSVSEGLGEDRYVAVVAKGTVRPACRRMTAEQQDHAVALWLLWKQLHKTQQGQAAAQQQEEQQQPLQPQPHSDCPDLQQTAPAMPGGVAADFSSLTLADPADAADSDSSDLGHAAAASGPRMYSRDEVAQMLVENQLTAELAELWEGPQGVEQRAVRLICLAAAAGDLEELQALLRYHPQIVPGAVGDLSAGGALPLHLAAAGGCVGVVLALLAAGAPLEARDGKGLTALQVSQRSEQCDVEAVLMQAGAADKQKDAWGTLDMPGGFL